MSYTALSDDVSTLSQFTRRKAITVTTGGTSTPNGYQVKLTISYESEMQADFDDIRFNTKTGGYIDYWIEGHTASTTAIVWVELPDAITDPGADTIWMYYGNLNLSDSSNVGNAFVFGDDFPGSAIDTEKWTEQLRGTGGSIVVSNGECALTIPDDQTVSASIESNTTFTNNIEIRIKRKCPNNHRYIGTTLGSGTICDPLGGTSDWWLTTKHSAYHWSFQNQEDSADNEIYEMPSTGAREDISSDDATCTASEINNYNIFKYIYDSTGNLYWYIIESSNGVETSRLLADANDTTFLSDSKKILISQGGFSTPDYGATSYLDFVIVRKYITNEPTVSYGTAMHRRRIPQFIG